MSASECAVGLLVDLSEPSPQARKALKQKKSRSKNRKKSQPENLEIPEISESKENAHPAPAAPVDGRVRRGSITLSEAPDFSQRVLVDVTTKSSGCNGADSPLELNSIDVVTPLDDERFDFDLASSPALPQPKVEKEVGLDEEEVFFGPVSFAEKCTAAALKSEANMKPLSPLTSSQMAEIVKEAHTVAYRIASMMSNSSSDSDRSQNHSSYSSPIARWKANALASVNKTPKKGSVSPPSSQENCKSDNNCEPKISPVKTPCSNVKTENDQGSGRRSSARLKRSGTFTIKEKPKDLIPNSLKKSLKFKPESKGDSINSSSPGYVPPAPQSIDQTSDEVKPVENEVKPVETEVKPVENEVKPFENEVKPVENEVKRKPSQLRKSTGISKPSGLKPPASRKAASANNSLKKSSSSESLASCPGTINRRDSMGSEGTAENLSIGSDISDISTASTASNISTASSRSSKLPTGRLSGTGLPRLSNKADTGIAMKRMSYGGSKTGLTTKGPMKANPSIPGLNKSYQTPASRLSASFAADKSQVKEKNNNSVGALATPRQRYSLGPSPGGLLKGRTPKLPAAGNESVRKPTPGPASTSKLTGPKRLNNGPLTKQSLVKPSDIHRKTLAANRNKQFPALTTNGPLKATGDVPNRLRASPKPHPAVKKSVESVTTPVKVNKSVQPKKLSLSTSFDSPTKSIGGTCHVAASTPRSTSKSANRRSFLPTPTKSSRVVSNGSIPPSSPLLFPRGVSSSSVKSYGSSIRCDSDSVFESSNNITGPGGDNGQ